jgi:hypothetical protein
MYPADIGNRLICVMPTSPVKSHPSTDLIDRTIASVRQQVGPDVLLIILADGVRPEQREMLKPYHLYVAQLRRTYGLSMSNFVMEFFLHKHQVGMLRWLIQKHMWAAAKPKPHILLVEHDAPFTPDPIDWGNVLDLLDSKQFDVVRFLFEGDINEAHRHMAGATINFKGMDYVETRQYSARPNVATWDFYERALGRFSSNAVCFFEDLAHSFCQEEPEAWKIGIYYPPPPRGRSFHLDGRQGDAKYDERQVF